MKKIPFRIVGLQVDNFTLSGKQLDSDKPFDVSTNYEFGVKPDDHLVMARLTYTYTQTDVELLQMTLTSTFDVEPESFQKMLNNEEFTIDPFFLRYISTINVGAARGEIHARCEQSGSDLSNVILPPVNLVEALPEAITITL